MTLYWQPILPSLCMSADSDAVFMYLCTGEANTVVAKIYFFHFFSSSYMGKSLNSSTIVSKVYTYLSLRYKSYFVPFLM